MEGLVIGIDLCNHYTQVSCMDDEKAWTIPTVICKMKKEDTWYVGEDAFAHTLVGDGIIVDKLIDLVMKDGTATLGGVKYEALELLKLFLKKVLELPEQEYGILNIKQIVFTLKTVNSKLMEVIRACADYLELDRSQIHVISHAESFIYYTLSQKKEVWINQVGMFDLAEDRLRYYELKVSRGLKKTTVVAEYEDLEEGFNLDILQNASGAKLADKILCSCADRLLQKKTYSAVILTGKGFETQDWAEDFMRTICNRRRVYVENMVFAKGAAYKAADYCNEKSAYPFVCICEGRLNTTVSMNVINHGQEMSVILATAGDSWYDISGEVDVIPDGQDYLEFSIAPLEVKKKRQFKVMLEGFPKRPERTTRVGIHILFLDEKTMRITLKDKGFGELFPATELEISQEVMV